MDNKSETGSLFLSILDLDTLINKLEEIDDLTSDIDLKFPFKIDSLISIIREKSFELEDYLKEELKIKEGDKDAIN